MNLGDLVARTVLVSFSESSFHQDQCTSDMIHVNQCTSDTEPVLSHTLFRGINFSQDQVKVFDSVSKLIISTLRHLYLSF